MRRKTLLFPALALAVIGGAWWWAGPPVDPVYGGYRLSEWVREFQVPDAPNQLNGQMLHAMGPKGVAWLAYALEHGQLPLEETSPLEPPPLSIRLRQWFRHGHDDYDERLAAAQVLALMGPDAAPAIAALGRAVEADDPDLVMLCSVALNRIGRAAWPVIEDKLAHGSEFVRAQLTESLWLQLRDTREPPTNADVARVIAALINACRDPALSIRETAAIRLGRWEPIPGTSAQANAIIPGLIGLLAEPHSGAGITAAGILEDYCTEAEAAIPSLIKLLDDPDPKLRAAAARALRAIDTREQHSAARLREMLNDPDADCQCDAARALDTFAEPPDE